MTSPCGRLALPHGGASLDPLWAPVILCPGTQTAWRQKETNCFYQGVYSPALINSLKIFTAKLFRNHIFPSQAQSKHQNTRGPPSERALWPSMFTVRTNKKLKTKKGNKNRKQKKINKWIHFFFFTNIQSRQYMYVQIYANASFSAIFR